MARVIAGYKWKEFEDFDNWDEYDQWQESVMDEIIERSNKATVESPVHFLLQFPVADGYAYYIVHNIKPLELFHVPCYDGWKIPDAHVRGLNIDHVIIQIKQRDFWEKIIQERSVL